MSQAINLKLTNLLKKNKKLNYIEYIEKKNLQNKTYLSSNINIGDIVRISYLIPEADKERTQQYQGLIIAKQNSGLGKSFTIRRIVQGIGVEQIFLFYSPKILSVKVQQSSKIRRAKLYFIRNLSGKSSRLKIKF